MPALGTRHYIKKVYRIIICLSRSRDSRRNVFPPRVGELCVVHNERARQGGDGRRVPGGEQEQRRAGGREDVQPAQPHAAARRADARVRGAQEGET